MRRQTLILRKLGSDKRVIAKVQTSMRSPIQVRVIMRVGNEDLRVLNAFSPTFHFAFGPSCLNRTPIYNGTRTLSIVLLTTSCPQSTSCRAARYSTAQYGERESAKALHHTLIVIKHLSLFQSDATKAMFDNHLQYSGAHNRIHSAQHSLPQISPRSTRFHYHRPNNRQPSDADIYPATACSVYSHSGQS